MWFDPVMLTLNLLLYLSGMNVFKSERVMGETNDLDIVDLRFLFKLDLIEI